MFFSVTRNNTKMESKSKRKKNQSNQTKDQTEATETKGERIRNFPNKDVVNSTNNQFTVQQYSLFNVVSSMVQEDKSYLSEIEPLAIWNQLNHKCERKT